MQGNVGLVDYFFVVTKLLDNESYVLVKLVCFSLNVATFVRSDNLWVGRQR